MNFKAVMSAVVSLAQSLPFEGLIFRQIRYAESKVNYE